MTILIDTVQKTINILQYYYPFSVEYFSLRLYTYKMHKSIVQSSSQYSIATQPINLPIEPQHDTLLISNRGRYMYVCVYIYIYIPYKKFNRYTYNRIFYTLHVTTRAI